MSLDRAGAEWAGVPTCQPLTHGGLSSAGSEIDTHDGARGDVEILLHMSTLVCVSETHKENMKKKKERNKRKKTSHSHASRYSLCPWLFLYESPYPSISQLPVLA